MLNKPITARTILFVAISSGFAYVFIATLVNIKLILDLCARPLSFDTVTTALERADGCLGPWLLSQFAICFIVAACASGGADGASTSWASSDDDGDDDGEESVHTFSWQRPPDDDFRINPATGLVMISASFDAGGHAWACSD